MKIYTTPLSHKIYVFENAIPSNLCRDLRQSLPNNEIAKYVSDPKIPTRLYELYTTYCNPSPLQFVAYTDKYTYGSSVKPVPYHTDPHDKKTQQWKVLMYLNSLSNAGTIFREGGQDIVTGCNEGSVVVFDTAIPHFGNPEQSPSDVKYTIGFFPLTQENKLYFNQNASRLEMIWERNKMYVPS